MSYARIIAGDYNRLVQGCGSLLGIASGLLADNELNNAEILFLRRWLAEHETISTQWPGDVLYARVLSVLEDGVITEVERSHLVETLQKICGGSLEAEDDAPVNQLAFDDAPAISFPGSTFCVTGDFVYGPRERVWAEITCRGGIIQKGVTKKLQFLVVGLQGSEEWKHGSFGAKMVKAVEYRRAGIPICIVREDLWSSALR
jgi:NAD-dependent DNA ligase